ncbi:uncharacterized protein AB675_5644 [Cyphellophora attinorum]|uniref:ER membrane protein complex subunit 7 beta-sandwich domain-containing protein n=1 Tax=Cyphellophora attinorum TaxID=1664694 RepID=A0A0N1HD26_9EURO|nr:uncharacterized protein AB675_5644 [Phialophora attinorum]KPI42062.1 hypothetical protein AB675_5644 [Phialophora attinorum]
MRRLVSLATAVQLLALTLAASIRINIPPSTLLPNPNVLPASTHATLTTSTGPELRAVIRKGNYIEFPSIPTTARTSSKSTPATTPEAGLQIIGAYETYHGTQWSDHGIQLNPNGQPTTALTLNAKVLSKKNFYETRPGFNVLSLLKNPMILMGGVALLFTFGMPKLMENMDPEMKAEYEEMQKKSPVAGLTRAMQGGGAAGAGDGFDLAGFLAGKQSDSGGGEGAASSGSTKGSSGGIRERKR